MSSFLCEKCGAACIDTPYGYATGCDHHLADAKPTPNQLSAFCRKEFGEKEEYGFCCRLELMAAGWLTDGEYLLLALLLEVWRDSLVMLEGRPHGH